MAAGSIIPGKGNPLPPIAIGNIPGQPGIGNPFPLSPGLELRLSLLLCRPPSSLEKLFSPYFRRCAVLRPNASRFTLGFAGGGDLLIEGNGCRFFLRRRAVVTGAGRKSAAGNWLRESLRGRGLNERGGGLREKLAERLMERLRDAPRTGPLSL